MAIAEFVPFQPYVPKVSPEEAARANVYGLLARLFYAPPDAALLKSLADAPDIQAEDSGELASAWKALSRRASR
jgi:TorA maturation chaperone TorD